MNPNLFVVGGWSGAAIDVTLAPTKIYFSWNCTVLVVGLVGPRSPTPPRNLLHTNSCWWCKRSKMPVLSKSAALGLLVKMQLHV